MRVDSALGLSLAVDRYDRKVDARHAERFESLKGSLLPGARASRMMQSGSYISPLTDEYREWAAKRKEAASISIAVTVEQRPASVQPPTPPRLPWRVGFKPKTADKGGGAAARSGFAKPHACVPH